MPVYQSLLDNDAIFNNLSKPPIVINTLSNITTEDREAIQRLITTVYTSDMVSILPSCQCGATKGEFSKITICSTCNTEVISSIEDTIEPLVWFKRPEGVEKLFSPIIWLMLDERFTKSKYSVLRWLTDTSYSPQIKRPKVIEYLEERGFRRGYNNFVENFFPIVFELLEYRDFKIKKNKVDYLKLFLETNMDKIFSDHISVLSKSLLIIEKTSFATYIDGTVPMALNAIEMLVSIDKDFYEQSKSVKENRTARAMYMLSCVFYKNYIKTIVAKKSGILRHYVGGSRFDFSARAVISSITDPHKYDEMIIPWGVGVTLFRPLLLSKLMRIDKLTFRQACTLLNTHVSKYDEKINRHFIDIIASTKEKRYPVIFNRFPSLLQGSIQRLFIPKINTDPRDQTFKVSILVVAAPNADDRS